MAQVVMLVLMLRLGTSTLVSASMRRPGAVNSFRLRSTVNRADTNVTNQTRNQTKTYTKTEETLETEAKVKQLACSGLWTLDWRHTSMNILWSGFGAVNDSTNWAKKGVFAICYKLIIAFRCWKIYTDFLCCEFVPMDYFDPLFSRKSDV